MATLNQKITLLSGLLLGNRARNGPYYVDIDLTERCNLNCLGCPYHNVDNILLREKKEAPQEMPFDLFKRVCTELRELKTHTLVLQGSGEPFLHPQLVDCVRTGKELGFYVILFTNGTLLNPDTIHALSDARLDTLKISLWATSREQFAHNYPGTNPAIFQKVKRGLEQLGYFRTDQDRRTFGVQLHFIINRINYSSVNEMVSLARMAKSQFLSVSPMVNLRRELNPLILSKEQAERFQESLRQAKERLESLDIQHNFDEASLRFDLGETVWKELPCYVLWYHARIRADGSLQPCGRCIADIEFGNMHTHSFQEVWNSSPAREFRSRTRSLKGLASIQSSCNCQYCCFVEDNNKIHRFMRWLSPLFIGRKNHVS